jgi:hypothetical protein
MNPFISSSKTGKSRGWIWRHTSVIPVTQKAEIGMIMI